MEKIQERKLGNPIGESVVSVEGTTKRNRQFKGIVSKGKIRSTFYKIESSDHKREKLKPSERLHPFSIRVVTSTSKCPKVTNSRNSERPVV